MEIDKLMPTYDKYNKLLNPFEMCVILGFFIVNINNI